MKKRIDPKLPIAPVGGDGPTLFGKTVDAIWAWLMRPDSFGDRLVRRLNELFREFTGTLSIYDEGTYLGEADGVNFVGTAVAATQNTTLPGVYDVTVTASSGGGDTITATAVENIAAGQFVAVYDASGTPKCRVAKSSSGQGYQADGFCKDAFLAGAVATIYLPGALNVAGGTGLTAGDVWLGTDGYATNTAPSTAGYISQQIGVAEDATKVAFEPQPDILIADAHAVGVINGGYLKTIVFTSSGTLTIPTGVTGGWITGVGGGGGGGSRTGALGGGGGGAGEKCVMQPIEVVSGAAYTVTIGAKGTGGTAGADGGNGGDTIFAAAQTWTFKGGKGGKGASSSDGGAGGGLAGATAGSTAGAIESIAFWGGASGGTGGTSTANAGLGGGADGGMNTGTTGGASVSSQAGGGGGGSTIWGLGGNGGDGGSAGASATASHYGAGGGGAGGLTGSSNAGGDGAPGYLLFMYVG